MWAGICNVIALQVLSGPFSDPKYFVVVGAGTGGRVRMYGGLCERERWT